MPLVRRDVPDVTLTVVGRNPYPGLVEMAKGDPSLEVTGRVEDVRPYMERAAAYVVPIRVGGGTRLKILEALACATPVVSTRVGAEGLHLEPGLHLTVVEDTDHLAEVLVSTIRHPEPAQEQARCGRRRVLERYDWDRLADRLERVWYDVVASG
jgi:glycosyltransferase involved in cell wall biosynthesis